MSSGGLAGFCCGSGRGGCGVLGLELPEALPRGTTGDWEPEEGLCPLVARGEAWPRLRVSIISRKLRETEQRQSPTAP